MTVVWLFGFSTSSACAVWVGMAVMRVSLLLLYGRPVGRGLASRVYFELRPFIPALAVVKYVCNSLQWPAETAWRILILALILGCWWLSRHFDKDDDDRWKRRRRKLAAKVASVGGRLQVVPAGSSG